MKNVSIVVIVIFLFSSFKSNAQANFSIGFTFAPQVTSSNGKDWKQISPLHFLLHCQANDDFRFSMGYTVQYHNIAHVISYKKSYILHLTNTNASPNGRNAFIGFGYVFPVADTKNSLFIELGTPYKWGGEQKLAAIFSTGVFIPFTLDLGK